MEHQQQQHQDMAAGSPAEIKNDPGWVLASFPLRDNSFFGGGYYKLYIVNHQRHCRLNCGATEKERQKSKAKKTCENEWKCWLENEKLCDNLMWNLKVF